MMSLRSMKADEGKHGHDDHDQPDQIDYAVHSILPANDTARVQLFRHFNGEAWAFLAEVSGSHQYGSANKNHEHRTHKNAQNAACAATTISHDRLPKDLDARPSVPPENACASVRFLRPWWCRGLLGHGLGDNPENAQCLKRRTHTESASV